MKKLQFLFILLLAAGSAIAQQQPLIGSWEMISIKGTDVSGRKFSNDTSAIREIKIITPTHYMLIAFDVEADSLVFNRTYFGEIRLDKNKYEEVPLASSQPIFENVKTDYRWKIDEAGRFIQSGTFTRPDGKKVVLEELIFRRLTSKQPSGVSPINGTWKLLSSDYTSADGILRRDTDDQVTGFHLFTPTHWMYISMRDQKFEHVMGGTFTMDGIKYKLNLDYASFPKKLWGDTEMTHKIEGNKLRLTGRSTFPDGRQFTWEDVLQKID